MREEEANELVREIEIFIAYSTPCNEGEIFSRGLERDTEHTFVQFKIDSSNK